MQTQKMSLLESSIDLIKEKMKSYEFFRSNIETRYTNLEARCAALANSTSINDKQNLSSFDHLLSQSHVFANSLKKVDANSMLNLKKLQDYLGELIHQQNSKFGDIEQRILSMFSQKQKILRNLTLQMENSNHSIKAIQEWIKTDHNRGNSFIVMEENLNQRLNMIQKNNQMKVEIIDEKIKYFESLQESAANSRKKYAEDRDSVEEELKIIKKDIKRRMEDLQQRLNEEKNRKLESLQSKFIDIPFKIEKYSQNLQQLNSKLAFNQETLENKLNKEITSVKEMIKENQVVYQQKQLISNKKPVVRQEQEKFNHYQDQNQMTTPVSQERVRNQYSRFKSNEEIQLKSQMKKNELNDKKPLPPKKNLFTPQSPPEIEKSSREMSGGIRGLLQKSKQKQRQEIPRRTDTLSRQKSTNKGLPPVREDPFAKKKQTQNSRHKKQESESQREQVVYEIDEEGYLMDQQGNYLLNEFGEMIRLSPQEIEQYMEEGDGF